MEVIAVTNQKGGVGKTTTAQSLGAGLHKRGFRVLLIDTDSQCDLTHAQGITTSDDDDKTTMALLEGEASIKDCIIQTQTCDMIPASRHLANAERYITDDGREYKLKEALQDVKKAYDFVIIDTPPSLDIRTINALTAANKVVVTSEAAQFSIDGTMTLHEIIQAIQEYTNSKLKVDGLLITRYITRAIVYQDMKTNAEILAKYLNTKVYATPIRHGAVVGEANARKTDIFTYSPRSNVAKDYDAFIEEFLKGVKKK